MADDTSFKSQTPDRGAGNAAAGPGTAAFVALRSGLAIRQYVIEEVIGAGGFGITYRARHERLTSKVFALKEFFPRQFAVRNGTHVVSTPDGQGIFHWGLDRFLKEAEALARCEHPGIVDVVDYFEANGTAYAVLGYVEGQQMGQWLDRLGRPPSQDELDRVLMPLLDALLVVHRAKLLHRDIAPDNIMIRRDGSPCLIDFGACREDMRERSRKISAIVKHGYSPPEQYHGIAELQGPWTDIYAVGATIYRAVAGQPPMDSSRRGALGDGLKPVGEMTGTAYRPGFLAAIDMALRLKPDERPQSIDEWRGMLTSTAEPAELRDRLGSSAPARGDAPERSIRTAPSKPGPHLAEQQADGSGAVAQHAGNGGKAPKASIMTHNPRRGAWIAGVAVLALAGMGVMAYWRSPAPSTDPQTLTIKSKVAAQSLPDAKGDDRTGPIEPLPLDTEQLAKAAWTGLAGTTDIAAIDRFIREHGATRAADAARAALAALRQEEQRIAEATAAALAAARAKEAADRIERAAQDAWVRIGQTGDAAAIAEFLARHGATPFGDAARTRLAALQGEAERRRTRDSVFADCQASTGAQVVAACSRVIDSDAAADRRAFALQARGNAERRAGDFDKAIADLSRSLELVPAQAQVLVDRGIARFLKGGQGSREAAVRDYDDAIRVEPRHAEALNNRAWAILLDGRAADALADANRSIEAVPTNGYAYDTRGQILESLGRRNDAIRDYERALQLDASQETSRTGLARLRARR